MHVHYLFLREGAIATLDYVLLDMVQVNGWRQFPPLPAVRSCALYPHWQVLVYHERLCSQWHAIPCLLFPHTAPLEEHLMAWLVATGNSHNH